MKAKIILWAKILWLMLVLLSICATGYYFVYQGFIRDSNIEEKEKLPERENDTIIENKVEDVIHIANLVKTDTDAGKYLKKILEQWLNGELSISLQIKKAGILNSIFNYQVFQETKWHTLSLNIKNNSGNGEFLLTGKVNGRTIQISGKYDKGYVYIDTAVLNGVFATMNAEALDYFFDKLGGFIDYNSFHNKKISFVPLVGLDGYIGKSSEEYYTALVNWLLPIFECKKWECSLLLNIETVDKIKTILDNSVNLTEKQKKAILGLSIRALEYVSWSSVILKEDGSLAVTIDGNLDMEAKISFIPKEIKVENNLSQYKEKTMQELIDDFYNRNPLFSSVLTNKNIIDKLLE